MKTNRQRIISHLVTCIDRLAQKNISKKAEYYWDNQFKKGVKIINLKKI
jgi:hypothetical protein